MGDSYCVERKNPSKNEEGLFLDEVDFLCPLCGKYLITNSKQKKYREFEIAHIYPNSPTPWEEGILNDVERLGENSEDSKNKIALCKSCHGKYDEKKTLDEYIKLLNIKKECLSRQAAKSEVSSITIEDEVTSVLSALDRLNDENINGIEKLSYDALKINEKIDDSYLLLRRDISMNVAEYYTFVSQELKNLNQIKNLKFQQIASEVRTAYLKCVSNEDDKSEIFKSLVNWLISKTGGSEEACRIVISFFVQNCEVYDKFPK